MKITKHHKPAKRFKTSTKFDILISRQKLNITMSLVHQIVDFLTHVDEQLLRMNFVLTCNEQMYSFLRINLA